MRWHGSVPCKRKAEQDRITRRRIVGIDARKAESHAEVIASTISRASMMTARAHFPALACTRATSSSTLGRMRVDDHVDAGRGRMEPVALVELGVAGDAVEEERIEQRVVLGGEIGIDRLEAAARNRRRDWAPPACRPAAPAMWRSVSRRTICVERAARDRGIDPAQHVVGAELEDDGVGPVRHRPVEPARARRWRCRRKRRHWRPRPRCPLALQRLLELGRKGGVGRQAVAGGERIAERHDLHRPVGGARPAPARTRPRRCRDHQRDYLDQHASNSHMSGGRAPGAGRASADRRTHCMNDTSARGNGAAIALTGVNLSLGRGAARVHILKDIDLHIGRGEAIGLVGPSGSGKSTLLMVMAGLERPDTGSVVVAGETLDRARRGRAGALPRPQCRHRVPVVPPDPDHDGARKRRGAARTRRRRRRARTRRAGACRGRARRARASLSGAALRRRAAARRARARARAQSGDPDRRRADRQSRRDDRRRDHRPDVRRSRRARHHAGAGHARSGAGARAATAWCGCARAGSRREG